MIGLLCLLLLVVHHALYTENCSNFTQIRQLFLRNQFSVASFSRTLCILNRLSTILIGQEPTGKVIQDTLYAVYSFINMIYLLLASQCAISFT